MPIPALRHLLALLTASVLCSLPAGAEAQANLAAGKPAQQSSLYQSGGSYGPEGGVDGVIDGSFGFHTDNEANPWWQVDLGARARISAVMVYNRLSCCSERARTLQVLLSDDGANWRTVYRHNGTVFGGQDGNPLRVSLDGATARYVRLQLAEANWLHLDEVQVLGDQAPAAPPPAQGGRGPVAGRWTYRHGDFTDTHEFLPNGRMGGAAGATWRIEGEWLVVRWPNGWTNVYGWGTGRTTLSGIALGPGGETAGITLTSSGVEATAGGAPTSASNPTGGAGPVSGPSGGSFRELLSIHATFQGGVESPPAQAETTIPAGPGTLKVTIRHSPFHGLVYRGREDDPVQMQYQVASGWERWLNWEYALGSALPVLGGETTRVPTEWRKGEEASGTWLLRIEPKNPVSVRFGAFQHADRYGSPVLFGGESVVRVEYRPGY